MLGVAGCLHPGFSLPTGGVRGSTVLGGEAMLSVCGCLSYFLMQSAFVSLVPGVPQSHPRVLVSFQWCLVLVELLVVLLRRSNVRTIRVLILVMSLWGIFGSSFLPSDW